MDKIATKEQLGTTAERLKGLVSDLATATTEALEEVAGTVPAQLETARAIDGVNFDGSANVIHYGTCSTAAATAAKTVSVSNFTLVTGARVLVRFSYTNTASSPTLNVSGTGAKTIRYRNAVVPANYIQQYGIYEFVYSGSYWYLVGDVTAYLYSQLSTLKDKALLYRETLWTGLSKTATVSLSIYSGERLFMIMGFFSSDGETSDQAKALGKQVYWLCTTGVSNYTASRYASINDECNDLITITGSEDEIIFASNEIATSSYHFYLTNIYQIQTT